MQRSTQPSSDCLLTHGGLMIALGTAVCATGSLMAMPIHAALGYLIAAALIGVCLVMSFLCFGARYKQAMPSRVIAAYITVGSSMVCYTTFSIIYWGWLETPVVGLFAGLLGLLWAGWFMSLAFTFPPASTQAIGLCALAAANSSFGFILASRTGFTRLTAVTAAGCYTILLGVEVYLTAVMLHRQVMRERALDRR